MDYIDVHYYLYSIQKRNLVTKRYKLYIRKIL